MPLQTTGASVSLHMKKPTFCLASLPKPLSQCMTGASIPPLWTEAGEIFNLRAGSWFWERHDSNCWSQEQGKRTTYMTEAIRNMLKERVPENPNELIFKDRDHGGKIEFVSRLLIVQSKRLGFNNGVTDSRQRVSFIPCGYVASWLALWREPWGNSILTIKELLDTSPLPWRKGIPTSSRIWKNKRYWVRTTFDKRNEGRSCDSRRKI